MKPALIRKITPLAAQRLTFIQFSMTLGSTFAIILHIFCHTAKSLFFNNCIHFNYIQPSHDATFSHRFLIKCFSFFGSPQGLRFFNFMLLFYRKVRFGGPLRPLQNPVWSKTAQKFRSNNLPGVKKACEGRWLPEA